MSKKDLQSINNPKSKETNKQRKKNPQNNKKRARGLQTQFNLSYQKNIGIIELTNCKHPEDSREVVHGQDKLIKNCDTVVTRFFIENVVNYVLLPQSKRLVLLP